MQKIEKETIIIFNELEPKAIVEAYNVKMLNRLLLLAKEFPEDVEQIEKRTFSVNKKLVAIRKPLTNEQRARLQANARKAFGHIAPDGSVGK